MKSGLFVSICIPVYNGEKYLAKTLDSIVNQTYPHREIIVSDNVSTDDSPRIAQEYMRKHNIQYSPMDTHTPIGEYNANRCVALAKGEAVCVYHADDIYEPQIVARCVEVLKKYPNVGAVFTMAKVIDEKGHSISRYVLPPELRALPRDYYRFDEIFSCVLKYENSFLVCPSAMVRKSVYDELGAWEYEKYRFASDLGLWFKIAQKYDVAIIDEPLINYRVSRSQGSQVIARQRTERADYFRVMEAFAGKIQGHRNRYYYQASLMKDCVYRALNLSLSSSLNESNILIKEAWRLYGRSFFPFLINPKTMIYFFISLMLAFMNRMPFATIRSWYHHFIFKLVGIKKQLFSY